MERPWKSCGIGGNTNSTEILNKLGNYHSCATYIKINSVKQDNVCGKTCRKPWNGRGKAVELVENTNSTEILNKF